MDATSAETDRDRSLRQTAVIGYALMAIGILISILYVAVPILAHGTRRAAAGSWLESHFRWQIRTFWFSLLWLVIGLLGVLAFLGSLFFMFLFVGHPQWLALGPWLYGGGLFLIGGDLLWVVYRVIRGWVRLARRQPMYAVA